MQAHDALGIHHEDHLGEAIVVDFSHFDPLGRALGDENGVPPYKSVVNSLR